MVAERCLAGGGFAGGYFDCGGFGTVLVLTKLISAKRGAIIAIMVCLELIV